MITSGAAQKVYPGWSAYGASKAAMDQWVHVVGAEQQVRGGVKVFGVAPGVVDTPMQGQVPRPARTSSPPSRSSSTFTKMVSSSRRTRSPHGSGGWSKTARRTEASWICGRGWRPGPSAPHLDPAGSQGGGGPAAHLRHHQPPRCRQDHPDREVSALRRRGDRGRRGPGPVGAAEGNIGLDGDGAAAGDLDLVHRAAVQIPGPRGQPAGHPGTPRLLGGHLPGPGRRRRRGHGAGRRQGHRGADPQAVRGLPLPQPADPHVPEQVRPARPGPARVAGRDRRPDQGQPDAGDLAGGCARRLPGSDRPSYGGVRAVHPHGPGGDCGAGGAGRPRAGGAGGRDRLGAGERGVLAVNRGGRRPGPQVFSCRREHPDVRRVGPDQLRGASPAGCGGRPGPVPRAPQRHRRGSEAARLPPVGIRLQDPGQHEPRPPGPHRVCAHLLRAIRAGDDRRPRPDRQAVRH